MKQPIPTPAIVAVVVVVVLILAYFGFKSFNSVPGPSGQTQATLDHYKSMGKQPSGMMGGAPGAAGAGAQKPGQ